MLFFAAKLGFRYANTKQRNCYVAISYLFTHLRSRLTCHFQRAFLIPKIITRDDKWSVVEGLFSFEDSASLVVMASWRYIATHHIPKRVVTSVLFLQQASLFVSHNLQPGLFRFCQHRSIYFQDVRRTIHIPMMQDTLPTIQLI